jgi:hypothetical protein
MTAEMSFLKAVAWNRMKDEDITEEVGMTPI